MYTREKRQQSEDVEKDRKRGGNSRRNEGPRQQSGFVQQAVPMLRYGTGNNFILFKERLALAASKEYGLLARFIETGEYYVPPEVDHTRYDLMNENKSIRVINKELYKEALKERARSIRNMDTEKDSIYAFIMQFMSHESLDVVKLRDDYESFSRRHDPLELWKAIEVTHKVATTGQQPAIVKSEARQHYQQIKQGSYESIVSFKSRFDATLKAFIDTGNVTPDSVDVAMDFYRALDDQR